MEKDLHKRLEEAAIKYAQKHRGQWMPKDCYSLERKEGFTDGAKWMFKEMDAKFESVAQSDEKGFAQGQEVCAREMRMKIIAQAKEWLETNIANQVEMMCAEGPLMMSKRTFLADFEADMNILWEEKEQC